MPTISIETTTVLFPYNHLYLVFKDDDGSEVVINAGPDALPPLPGIANLAVQIGVPIALSSARKDENGNLLDPEDNNSTVVDIGDRGAEDVWAIMIQHAQNIQDEQLPYDASVQLGGNSNTVIAAVLNAAGIDIRENYPEGTFAIQYPGTEAGFFSFDQILQGTNSADLIQGARGVDELFGNDGDDQLFGFSNNDQLFGGLGNDTLNGGDGADTIFGGADDDTIVGSTGEDILDGGDGIDTIDFSASFFRGLNVDLSTGTLDVQFLVEDIGIFGSGQTVANIENVTGTQFTDELKGNNQDNELRAGAGDDFIVGGGGDDTLYGGADYDELGFLGSFGHDEVNFSAGIETPAA